MTQTDKLELEKLIEQIEAAENRHDVNAMLGYMVAEPILHLCGMPPIVGQAAISQLYHAFFKEFISTALTTHKIIVSTCGDMAWEYGSYVNQSHGLDGPISEPGKYLGIYHKVEGTWKGAAFCITPNGD